jgi:hypothetical protein
MRKIGIGTAGDPVLGKSLILDNTVTTLEPDANLTLDPNGAGETKVVGHLQINSGSTIKLGDDDNSHWVALKAPASVTSDLTLTLPNSYGSSNQVLTSNGSGALSWSTPGVNVTNDVGTANNNNYLLFSSTDSGTITGVSVSNNKLAYQPSTGNLFVGILSGGEGASGNLTLRSTSSGTKGQVYIDETTASSSTTTGALRVGGGVGIGGNMYIGGTFTAQSITETSSIALKENVHPIENALDKIVQLAGVIYDRKDGSSTSEPGLIAEDVKKVIPELVTENSESVYYTKIGAYLIEAIKTLKEEIDIVKKKLG